jgi:hypothetical protein
MCFNYFLAVVLHANLLANLRCDQGRRNLAFHFPPPLFPMHHMNNVPVIPDFCLQSLNDKENMQLARKKRLNCKVVCLYCLLSSVSEGMTVVAQVVAIFLDGDVLLSNKSVLYSLSDESSDALCFLFLLAASLLV